MAEPADRSGPGSPAQAPAVHLPPPLQRDPSEVGAYRPLSLLAILGFSLAALYGAALVLFGVVALVRGSPILWPWETLAIPLIAACVSGAARLIIQRAEGTLAGGKLALWGVFLSVLFGMVYTAYLAAVSFVVRDQAIAHGKQWLETITRGTRDDIDKAFLDTLLVEQRPNATDNLHDQLEKFFNTPEGSVTKKGRYGMFCTLEMVQILRQGGKDTVIEPMGVKSWDHTPAGYEVEVNFLVTTREGSVEILVAVLGADAKRGGARQWSVIAQKTTIKPETKKATTFGIGMARAREQSYIAARRWLDKLGQGMIREAYLDTLAPKDRTAVYAKFPEMVADILAGTCSSGAAVLMEDPDRLVPGISIFGNLALLEVDADNFWSPDEAIRTNPAKRAEVLDGIRALLRSPEAIQSGVIHIEGGSELPAVFVGDKVRITHTLQIQPPQKAMIDVALVMEGDSSGLEEGKATSVWRVAQLKVQTVRPPVAPTGVQPNRPGPGGMGGGAQPPGR